MRIAIVEISESHEECIYSQLQFLKANGHTVDGYLNAAISDRISYKTEFNNCYRLSDINTGVWKKTQTTWWLFKKLRNYQIVIFNTASSSSIVRNLSLLLRASKVSCYGVLHNIKKLEDSFTQKIIKTKVKHYFVLNDLLLEHAKPNNPNIRLSAFYPIFFPKTSSIPIEKTNQIWIAIPGRLEYNRRNYNFLLEQLKQHPPSDKLWFIILGNYNTEDGRHFYNSIQEMGLGKRFVFFDRFISNETYYSYLKACDYILPLLQTNNKDYLKYKITGTFNLAIAYQKKLLLQEFYKELPDFTDQGIFYNSNNFIPFLNALPETENTVPYTHKKYDFAYQQQSYNNFINLELCE